MIQQSLKDSAERVYDAIYEEQDPRAPFPTAVRLRRKTYLVDLGGPEKRTDRVALSNTLIGVVLLVAGAIASLVQTLGNAVAIVLFLLPAFIACIFIYTLPETQEN